MSVIVKGVNIPKNCLECKFTDSEWGVCVLDQPNEREPEDYMKRSDWCPLAQIPPHGDLIEKNAVFELIRSFPNVDRQLPVEFMKALYELPTILEAEEGE